METNPTHEWKYVRWREEIGMCLAKDANRILYWMHVVLFYKPELVILNDTCTKHIGNDSEKFECVRKLITATEHSIPNHIFFNNHSISLFYFNICGLLVLHSYF